MPIILRRPKSLVRRRRPVVWSSAAAPASQTTLNIVGFDTGDASECQSTSGTVSFVSSPIQSAAGGYALRVNPTTTGTGWVVIRGPGGVNLSNSDPRCRFWFRYNTKPASASEEIAELDTGVLTRPTLRIDSTGKLSAWTATTQIGSTGTTVLAQDTWYMIEWKPLSGAWEVRVNGTTEISGSDTFTASGTQIAGFRFGKPNNRNSNSVDFFYDDVRIDDGGWPGTGECALLVPNAAGTYQTFTRGGADSGNNWDQVEEVPHNSDTDYLLSTGSAGDGETENLASLSGTATSIAAVKAIAVAKRNGASDGSLRLRIRSGTTDSDGTDVTITSSYATLGKLYATDPATSAAWAQSALDSVQVGVVERSTNTSRVTFMGLVVDYVPANVGTGALTAGPATCSGTATHDVPSYQADAAVTIAAVTCAAEATHAAFTYEATAAVTSGAATASGSATHDAPSYEASVDLTVGAATASASATNDVPAYEALADLVTAAVTCAASGTHTAKTYEATCALTVPAATIEVTGSQAEPEIPGQRTFRDAGGRYAALRDTSGGYKTRDTRSSRYRSLR